MLWCKHHCLKHWKPLNQWIFLQLLHGLYCQTQSDFPLKPLDIFSALNKLLFETITLTMRELSAMIHLGQKLIWLVRQLAGIFLLYFVWPATLMKLQFISKLFCVFEFKTSFLINVHLPTPPQSVYHDSAWTHPRFRFIPLWYQYPQWFI